MVIKGLNEGKGRKFDGKRFILNTTFSKDKKRLAMEDAMKLRRRGHMVRMVPIKIGFGIFSRRKK